MSIFLNTILITSVWCLGLTIVTQEHMLLYPVRKWAEEKKSKWFEPVIICEWCMPSFHSPIGYLFAVAIGVIDSFSWSLVFMYPVVVCGASVCTGIIWAIYGLINNATKYYMNAEQLKYFDIRDRKEKYHRSHIKPTNHG